MIKTIQIQINPVPPYPVTNDHLPGDCFGSTSPYHATSGQLSLQRPTSLKGFWGWKKMSSAGLSAIAGAPRLYDPPLHIGQTFHMLGNLESPPAQPPLHLPPPSPGIALDQTPPSLDLRWWTKPAAFLNLDSISPPTLMSPIWNETSYSR